MASSILIKRSTGSVAPGTITYGELAVTTGANGTQANAGDRLFIGDNNGAAQVVGGRYFTDLLDHVHGTLTASSTVIVDSNSKIDNWLVDDIQLNANVITTSTTDTDLIFRANGTGKLVIEDGQELEFGTTGDVQLQFVDADAALKITRVGATTPDLLLDDDMKLYFGAGKDGSIHYDETTSDRIQVEGADWTYNTGVQVNYADTTDASNRTTASVTYAGGIGVAATTWTKDLRVDDSVILGTDNTDALTVNSTTVFQNGVTFNGTTTITGNTAQTGEITIDQLKLDGNVLSTTSGTELIIDPFPAGGDADGLVIIKGDLQIDGTTTTVNSANMSVNDPTIELGDPTTAITVTTNATSGATDIIVDRVEGFIVGDSVTGTNIAGSTTISAINSGTSTLTLSAAITGNIASGQALTVTRAADDALDRGVKVHYYGGSGAKFGFFGYDRTGGADGLGAWTFIEDASDTNTVFGVNGNRGTVVLGDLELDTDLEVQYGGTGASTFTTNGIVYGQGASPMQVTAAANMVSPGTGSDATTSYQVLTVTSAGVPVWTNTIDGGTF
jgi:hypothetical protein